jgi:hypothetical protein
MSIDFSQLQPLGWTNYFHSQLSLDQFDTVRPARVIGVERDCIRVHVGAGPREVTLAGRYRHRQVEASDSALARR